MMINTLIAAFAMDDFLGRFHPLILHLPIGLLTGLLLIEAVHVREHGKTSLKVGRILAVVTALSAIAAALTGIFLGSEKALSGDDFDNHRLLGILFTFTLALAASLSFLDSKKGKNAYRLSLVICALLLAPVGHLGGNMVHGREFLTEKLPEWAPGHSHPAAKVDKANEGSVYATTIAPIMKAHCIECHGEGKSAGSLRLDTPEHMLKAGDSGIAAIVPGSPEKSELLRRLIVPADHPDYMPPVGESPLTAEETLVVAHWIQNGAPFTVDNSKQEDKLKPASEQFIASLAKQGMIITPADDEGIRIEINMQFAKVESKELLASIGAVAPQIGKLKLQGQLTAEQLLQLPQLSALHYLDLRGLEKITSAQLDAINTKAPLLHTLILSDVALEQNAPASLKKMKHLGKVYLAGTGLKFPAALELRKARIEVIYPLDEKAFPNRKQWKILSVSSEEILDNFTAHPARFAIDGNKSSIWHTKWNRKQPPYPHHLTIDLGKKSLFNTLSFLARQSGTNGTPAAVALYVSEDGKKWSKQPVWKGELFAKDSNLREFKKIQLPEWQTTRYIKLVFLKEINGQPFCSLAEFDLSGE